MLKKIKKTIEKILTIIFLSCGFLFIACGTYFLVLDTYYENRYYPRTQMFGNNIGGMVKKDADNEIFQRLNNFNKGLTFQSDNYKKTYNPENIGIEINLNKTIENTYNYGREPLTLNSARERLSLLFFGKNNDLSYIIKKDNLDNFIRNEIYPLGVTSNDIKFEKTGNDLEFTIGKQGLSIDREDLIFELNERISILSISPIEISFIPLGSVINKNEWNKIKNDINKIISSPITFRFEDKKWELKGDMIKDWILLEINDEEIGDRYFKKKLTLDLDREKFSEYMKSISPEISLEPVNARFQVVDGKLELLEASVMGREVLTDANFDKLKDAVIGDKRIIDIETKERGASITKDNIDSFGIKELIGEGKSNFAGSPRNRIQNINVAVEKLNGVLLAPDETYSLVENIGEVNAEAGFLPELVIKDNKTIPEYGGGLCQIATTIFRAAINTGLDVTERQSHSYAVSYYKPHGMDATVYIPHPDLRFHNDTDNYILIQAKIEGYNLTFEFFGTKDGRETIVEGPSYWDRKPDGAFKAKFSQIVKMPDGTERKDQFTSYYDSPDKYH